MLIKELQKLPPETEVQLESGPYQYKVIWLMHHKGVLTIGYVDTTEQEE